MVGTNGELRMIIWRAANSAVQGTSDDEILPISDARRRLGLDAELRHDRAQQPVVQAALHRRRQLRSQVSRQENTN